MPRLNSAAISDEVRHWLETIVIGLNLCPFAQRELGRDSIRFAVSEANAEPELLQDLSDELTLLSEDRSIETTLLIHPLVLQDFDHYNQFLSIADELLQEAELEGVFQIASFHPQYRFQNSQQDDAENYSNRSPYPMLHLLREASVENAISTYKNIENVPTRNIELLRTMGVAKIKDLLTSTTGK